MSRPKHTIHICITCGEEFNPHNGRAGVFCSMTCRKNFPPEKRFWPKVNKDGPIPDYAPHLGNCWLWTACLMKDGYGLFKGQEKYLATHIFSYESEYGKVPDGLELDHLCRVHACVRPSHLEAVTHQVNMMRGIEGMKTHCPMGHPYSGENLYINPSGNSRTCRTCRKSYMAAWHIQNRAHRVSLHSPQ